jgi:hypothetical protein
VSPHLYGFAPDTSVVDHLTKAHHATLLAVAAIDGHRGDTARALLDEVGRRLARMRVLLTGTPLHSAAVTVPEIGAPLTHTGSNHLDPAA